MQFSTYCIECLVHRQANLLHAQKDEAKAFACFKEMLQAIVDAPDNVAAPYCTERFNRIFERYFSDEDRYAQIKRDSNDYMLRCVPRIREVIESSADPLLTALKYARAGNYIDFGALEDYVNEADLEKLLENASEAEIEPTEYANYMADLKKAKKLLYLADNAGEIIADGLYLEQLRKSFPALDICVGVRGKPILNDALREDALAAGIDKYARIVDSGIGMGGTQIRFVSPELRHELDTADVILAKGQGNIETLFGCGLNVYYVFLCKCIWFTKLFRVPRLTGMFINERRAKTFDVTEDE